MSGVDLYDELEVATWEVNDLTVLGEVAKCLDEMRGNEMPRDLLIRITGGPGFMQPWEVVVYASGDAVLGHHKDEVVGTETLVLARLRDQDERRQEHYERVRRLLPTA